MLLVLALCIEQWPNQIPTFGAQTQSSTGDTVSEWGKGVRMGRQGGTAGQLSGPGLSGEALSRLPEEAMSEQRPEWSEDLGAGATSAKALRQERPGAREDGGLRRWPGALRRPVSGAFWGFAHVHPSLPTPHFYPSAWGVGSLCWAQGRYKILFLTPLDGGVFLSGLG